MGRARTAPAYFAFCMKARSPGAGAIERRDADDAPRRAAAPAGATAPVSAAISCAVSPLRALRRSAARSCHLGRGAAAQDQNLVPPLKRKLLDRGRSDPW